MNYPGKKPALTQMNGETGQVESSMQGGERIFSQEDTEQMIGMARAAKTSADILGLGKFVYNATRQQEKAHA